MADQFTVAAAKSGQAVILGVVDGAGDPAGIAGVRDPGDVQVLRVVGIAQGPSFRLGVGPGQEATIPLHAAPPLTSASYGDTLPAPGSYDLALGWGYYGAVPGGACTAAEVAVFDGPNLLGTVAIDQTTFPAAGTAVDVADPGQGIYRKLGSFAFATTALRVQLAGAAGSGTLLAGALRILPAGAADLARVGYIDPAPNIPPSGVTQSPGVAYSGAWALNFYYEGGDYNSFNHGLMTAAAAGTAPALLPRPAEVLAALQALPGVGPGSFAVDYPNPDDATALAVRAVGALGGQARPTLTSSDPAIAVVHDDTGGSSVGGRYATLEAHGRTYPLVASGFAPGVAEAIFYLPQDAPPTQVLSYGQYGTGLDRYPNTVSFGPGYTGRVGVCDDGGPATMTFSFDGLPGPAATYRLAATFPAAQGGSARFAASVVDGFGATLLSVADLDQAAAPPTPLPPAPGLAAPAAPQGWFADGDGYPWYDLGAFVPPALANTLTVVWDCPAQPGRAFLLDSVRLARVSAPVGLVLDGAAAATFAAPAGLIATQAGGPSPALAGLAVAPPPAHRLPPPATGPRTLEVGVNCDSPTYYQISPLFSNAAVQVGGLFGATRDGNGNPTRLFAAADSLILCEPPADSGLGRGGPNFPAGDWTVRYRGPATDSWSLGPHAGSTTVVERPGSPAVAGDRTTRTFAVADPYAFGPALYLTAATTNPAGADGLHPFAATDLEVYPPDVDPAAPGKFRGEFVAKVAGRDADRLMDRFGTNDLNLAEFAHFPAAGDFPLRTMRRALEAAIVRIGPPEPDPYSETVAGTVIRVETATPHGLTTGFLARILSTDGNSVGVVRGAAIATGAPRDDLDPTDGLHGAVVVNKCRVIDATTVQIGINKFAGPLARMTNTLTPGNAVLHADLAPGACFGPADACDLADRTGVIPWINVPALASDACMAAMAGVFAARLPRGRPIRVEASNEPWNYAFPAFFHFAALNALAGGSGADYVPAYVALAARARRAFRAAWSAAGRDPAEIRMVLNCQQDDSSTTGRCLAEAARIGAEFEEITFGGYWSNGPIAGALDALLTTDQCLDLLALNARHPAAAAEVAGHRANIAQASAAARAAGNPAAAAWIDALTLSHYEAGPDVLVTPAQGTRPARRSHAVHRHPEFAEVVTHRLGQAEALGVALLNPFTLYGIRDIDMWGEYEGYAMLPGTGDPAADAANVEHPEDLPRVRAEASGAYLRWTARPRAGAPAAPDPAALGRLLRFCRRGAAAPAATA